jgi:hypothetical protein
MLLPTVAKNVQQEEKVEYKKEIQPRKLCAWIVKKDISKAKQVRHFVYHVFQERTMRWLTRQHANNARKTPLPMKVNKVYARNVVLENSRCKEVQRVNVVVLVKQVLHVLHAMLVNFALVQTTMLPSVRRVLSVDINQIQGKVVVCHVFQENTMMK